MILISPSSTRSSTTNLNAIVLIAVLESFHRYLFIQQVLLVNILCANTILAPLEQNIE